MTSVTKKIVIGLSVIVFGFVAVGYVRGRSSDDKAFRALTVYGEVLDRIQREYVDEPNLHQVTSGALHGLFDSRSPSVSDTSASFPRCRIARPRKRACNLATSSKKSPALPPDKWPSSRRSFS